MNKKSINFPPNIDPQSFAWIAVLIGSICAEYFDVYEQNSLGNWLVLVGQFLETTSAQQQLIEARIQNNNNSSCDYANNLDFLLAAIDKIQHELENIKNSK